MDSKKQQKSKKKLKDKDSQQPVVRISQEAVDNYLAHSLRGRLRDHGRPGIHFRVDPDKKDVKGFGPVGNFETIAADKKIYDFDEARKASMAGKKLRMVWIERD
jgi:hypothetical protein